MIVVEESDVQALLDMPSAIEAVETALRLHNTGDAVNMPRNRLTADGTTLHLLAGAIPDMDAIGLKCYTTGVHRGNFWVLVFAADGSPLALVSGRHLSRTRTGAATGVATRWLSNADSRTLGLIGTGYQALGQLEAVCAVRDIADVLVWSPTRAHVERFCETAASSCTATLTPADDAESVVRSADVVVAITKTAEPIIHGRWLRPGVHLNLAGANHPNRREACGKVLERVDRIVVDDLAQARKEAGELIRAEQDGAPAWDRAVELGAVVAGAAPARRTAEEITTFKSLGLGIFDVATARSVYEKVS